MKTTKSNEFQKLASLIAMAEGKKHQATIGDIREILLVLKTACKEPGVYKMLCKYLLGIR